MGKDRLIMHVVTMFVATRIHAMLYAGGDLKASCYHRRNSVCQRTDSHATWPAVAL